MFFGYLIVTLGVIGLLSVLGVIAVSLWHIFWPLFFIAVGAKIIMSAHHCRSCQNGKCDTSKCGMWCWHCHNHGHKHMDEHGHGHDMGHQDGQM